jgi:hypothetical protein
MAKNATINYDMKLGVGNRLANWPDVWLCYPRAYLLISTSVDYSLSVGRLPHDNDIPGFLLNTPPDTPKVRLPWMTKADLINPSDATGADFWCPSYCASARPVSVIRPPTDAIPTSDAVADGSVADMAKPPLQVQTLWQYSTVYENVYNYQTTPLAFEQGPINLDFLNQIPSTAVPFFQPSANQLIPDDHGHTVSIPETIVGSEIGNYGQVYMGDNDNQPPNMWVLDYYNETARDSQSMLYSMVYPHTANETNDGQIDSNEGAVNGCGLFGGELGAL